MGKISWLLWIPVVKTQRYTIEEIFEKNLLFLIPFYIFSHESRFKAYESHDVMLETLKAEYECIKDRLEKMADQQIIDAYTKCTIFDMSNKVLEHIAAKYENIREGVKSVMGGQVLEYEAKRIKNEGIEQGDAQRLITSVNNIVEKLSLSLEEGCALTGTTVKEYSDAVELLKEGDE